MVPQVVGAKLITERLHIPRSASVRVTFAEWTILVTDDLLGKYTDFKPRFVRRYADLGADAQDAVANYANDVLTEEFPNASESFPFPEDEQKELMELIGEIPTAQGELTC